MEIEKIKTEHLKGYASFLYHKNLDNVIDIYKVKNKESGLYSDLSEAEISSLVKSEIREYLISIMEDKIADTLISWVSDLKENKSSVKGESYIRGMIFNRKLSLNHFLPEFTSDTSLIISIISEMEYLSKYQEDLAIEYYKQIQQENLNEAALRNVLIENELEEIKDDCEKSESTAEMGHWKLEFETGEMQCSKEVYHLLGIDEEQSLSYDRLKYFIVNENGYLKFLEKLSDSNEEKEYYSHRFKIKKTNGEIRSMISMDYPLYSSEGKIIGVKVFIRDITEMMLTEERLTERLERMQKILNNSPTLINIYDVVKDEVVYTNGAQQKIFGSSSKEVKDMKFSAVLDQFTLPEDKLKLKERLKNLKNLKDNEIDQLEYRLKDINGDTIWLYSRAMVFKRVNGKVKQVLLNALNITDLKKSEEERRYVESQLKEAQKIAHVGSFDWDIVSDVVIYTEEARRIYDFPLDKKLFKLSDLKTRIHSDDISRFEENLKNVFNSDKGLYEGEYRIALPDETKKDMVSRAKVIRDESGKPVRMLGTVMDITSIKKAEHELRKMNKEISEVNAKLEESKEEIETINATLEDRIEARTKELKENEEQYRFLAENVPQLFWTSQPEGEIDFLNKNVYSYTGVTLAYASEWDWTHFIHPDDLKIAAENWIQGLSAAKIVQVELRLRRADGVYRWHLAKGIPLKDKGGNVIKWMGIATDIDEQKKYAEELKKKNEQLTKINRDLDNFVYTASHDLKTPITNIEGLLNVLSNEMSEECKSQPENDTILNMMDTSVRKFKNTIIDLTEIARSQKSGEELIKDNDVNEILSDVKIMIEDLIQTSHAEIKTDFSDCPVIKFSRKNFRSILYNLLSNAIKFRSPERRPEIFISTQCVDDYILLSVKDNGLGFDPSQTSKVFEMFKRLHSHKEGSGIGLYLVKRIITNAGGKIEAESEKGKGSVFKVYFKA